MLGRIGFRLAGATGLGLTGCTAALLLAVTRQAVAQGTGGQLTPACDSVAGYRQLDFWLGEWDVYVGSTRVGSNQIGKILNGCAVSEQWRAANGGEGRSTFFHDPAANTWHQVWLTTRATAPGGLKQKRLTQVFADGGVRFEGTVVPLDGDPYLDRTTLSPLAGGSVRQLIEVSGDSGRTWRAVFDSEYRRRTAAPVSQPEYQRASAGTRWLESDGGLAIKVLLEAAQLGGDDAEIAEVTFPVSTGDFERAHSHGSTEILYIRSGELDHVVNGTPHRLTPGMVGVVRPGHTVVLRVVGKTPVKALIIWLPGGEAGRLARFLRQRPVQPH